MNFNKLNNTHLILASKSLRRQQLIKDLNLEFEIRTKEVDENYSSKLKGAKITDYLAKLKADSFINDLKQDDILITSDTIVWFNSKAIEKPANKEETIKILRLLSGKKHKVISSICLTTIDKQLIDNDVTTVYFKELTDEEINYYVENYNTLDKAGGYGIQEWIGYIGVPKIKGSYYNVMGFPIHKFYEMLLKL